MSCYTCVIWIPRTPVLTLTVTYHRLSYKGITNTLLNPTPRLRQSHRSTPQSSSCLAHRAQTLAFDPEDNVFPNPDRGGEVDGIPPD